MESTDSAFRFPAGLPISRGWLRSALLIGTWMWVWPVMAQLQGTGGGDLRVCESPSGGVDVEWTREAGPPWSLGWHVEKQSPAGGILRVTTEWVEAGLFDSPATVYRFHDAAALARVGDTMTYRLVVVDPEQQEWPGDWAALTVELPGASPAEAAAKALIPRSVPVRRDVQPPTVGSRVRIEVASDGLYRLTAAQIAAVLHGWDEQQVAQAIAHTNFSLSCSGEPVAWEGEVGGAALRFYGLAYRDTYVARNVYWLEPGAGRAIAVENHGGVGPVADAWFWDTIHLEKNLEYVPYVPGEAGDDYYIWTGQNVTAPARSWQWTTNVTLIDPQPNVKTGWVTARLVSHWNGSPPLDNRTRLIVSGQVVADQRWAGDERLAQTGMATNFTSPTVAVKIESLREPDVTTTTVLIDALEVRYARQMRARANVLLFSPELGATNLSVRGFSTAAILVYDVTDPLLPVRIEATVAAAAPSEWRASWTANPAVASRFLAVAQAQAPVRWDGIVPGGWDAPQAGAPHVVIASRALTNAAATLVAHRQQQGLDSILVPIEELYDDFAFGRRDPRAIPRFLAQARTVWTTPPQYVCLAGDGHLDYHDHFDQTATRPNHIPPIQDRIPYDAGGNGTMVTLGLDNPLADLDGGGAPDLAIGRLPAQTSAALTRMINRIVEHEALDAWKNKVLLVSDKDVNNMFGAARERLATHVPSDMTIARLGHTLPTPVSTMRTNFIHEINAGPLLAVYYGHANNVGISSPYFFEHSSVRSYMPSLTNSARLPLLLAGTCMLNNFSQPQPTSHCIGKGLLDTAPGGAIAVWASAAEVSLAMAEGTTTMIIDKLFFSNNERLGDLIWPALELQAGGASPWTVRSSVLMGDPGTRIRTHSFDGGGPVERGPYSGIPLAVPGTVEIENFDIGGPGSAYQDTSTANEGGQYRLAEGVDISCDPAAGNQHVVGWTKAGEWLEYTVNVATGGTYTLDTRVAAVGVGGKFQILVNGVDKTGLLTVPNTGAWNAYQVVQKTGVSLVAGVQTVRVAMVATGASGHVGAFDWFRLTAVPPAPARSAYGGTPWAVPGTVEMENFDVGGPSIAYHDTSPANEGGQYRLSDGVDISRDTTAGNQHTVGWTPAGEWLEYTVNVATGGTYTLETRVAAVGTGGKFQILVNGEDKTGLLTVPNTGAWNAYQVVQKAGVSLVAGVQTVRVAMVTAGASGNVAAFDWFKVVAAPVAPPRSAYGGTPWAVPGTVEMENFDVGGPGVVYSDTTAANEGGQYRLSDGVDISRDTTAGNQHTVGWTPAGEWLEYTVNVATGGTYTLETRVAAVGTGGKFQILVNGEDKTGLLTVPNTGAWNAYQVVQKAGVSLVAGVQTVRVAMVTAGTSGNVGAFDWFKVVAAPVAPERSAYEGTPWALPGIVEMENFDVGGPGVAYSDTTVANEGGQYRTTEQVDISNDAGAGNGRLVGWTKAGEWLEYTVNVTTSGPYTLETRVAAVGMGGQFQILVDGEDKTGLLNVPNTGAWNAYQVVQKMNVSLGAGIHTVRVAMVATGASGHVGAFDWFKVVAAPVAPERSAYGGTPWAVPGMVEIENFDVGGPGVAYSDTSAANEGGYYRTTEQVDISNDAGAGNGHVVGWTKAGEWLEYTVDVTTSGTYTLDTCVAAVGTGGKFRILVNGVDKTGPLNVPNTGAWNAYQVVQKTGVSLVSGVQTVRVEMVTTGISGHVGAFDWFRVTAGPGVLSKSRAVSVPVPDIVDVRVSDEQQQPGAGWLAVDGDPTTAWQGTPVGGGGYLVLAYECPWPLSGVDLNWEPEAPLGILFFSSTNAENWTEFRPPLNNNSIELQYLWLMVPVVDGEDLPALREINAW